MEKTTSIFSLLLLPCLLLSFLPHLSMAMAASNSTTNFLQCLLESSTSSSDPISSLIYTQDNSSFSSVLQTYIRNLRFNTTDTRKPLLILTATNVSHVQTAVFCARNHGLQMKIRSGGHDYEGVSYVSETPFFVLDMFNLRSISVDVEDESAWVETGATLGEVYYRIAEKSKVHGFPAGVCPTVGVGGHLSGGGYGNMMRKYGLTVDNIIDATLVDVNGTILDREGMGEDLFWAIRGGGGASFGVVLSYKIRLVRVPTTVTVFKVQRTLEQNATDLVYKWLHVADKLDNNLFIRLTHDVINSTQNAGQKTLRATFLSLFLGTSDRLLDVMNQSFPELGLQQSDCIEMSWVESILYWTNFPLNTSVDALLSRTPQVLTHLKRKSDYIQKPIPKPELEKIWKKMIELETPALTFNPYGGRMSEISETATPFPHRAGNICKIQYAANWNEEGTEAANRYINMTRELYKVMTPYVSKNPRQAFLNYRDLDLGINHNTGNRKANFKEGRVYGVKYFKGNFKRLVHVKTKVDPQNFFRNEQSIPVFPF